MLGCYLVSLAAVFWTKNNNSGFRRLDHKPFQQSSWHRVPGILHAVETMTQVGSGKDQPTNRVRL